MSDADRPNPTVDIATGTLHPGQTATHKWPVVGEKAPPASAPDRAGWRLEIAGRVERPQVLTLDDVHALPQRQLVADIHCVTSWSHLGMRLDGTPLAILLDLVGVSSEAHFVRFVAYSDREHDTSLPLELARADTWLIHGRDGEPLEPEHGGPLRTVTPSRYFYKSLKWLRRIELVAEDRLGYWERESAYHNQADPRPGDQRFTSGSIPPDKLERFRDAEDFRPYRGARKILIGADLAAWEPRSRALGDLYLKNCSLRDATLAGVDLRGANLSLSDLRGADLRGADLRGADLEGVRFAGADLRDADLRDTALSAASFHEDGEPPAKVTGMQWHGATGLLESEEHFLRRRT